MTDQPQPPYLVRLGEMQEDAAKLLFYSLPPEGWAVCTLEYREAGPVSEVFARMIDSDGNMQPVKVSPALINALRDIRKYMATNNDSVWYSAFLKIENGRFSFDFNYDQKPQWRVEPSDEAYIADLSKYPRQKDQIPDWYPRVP